MKSSGEAQMEQDFRVRLLDWLTHALKIVGAFAIAWFFIVSLMVATAQQAAVARLHQNGLNMDYGMAVSKRMTAYNLQQLAQEESDYLDRLRTEQLRIEPEVDAAAQRVDQQWADLEPKVIAIQKSGLCGISAGPAQTAPARAAIAHAIQRCTPASRASDAALVTGVQEQARAFEAVANAYIDSDKHLLGVLGTVQATQADLARDSQGSKGDSDLSNVFSDMDAIANMIPGANFVANFPPTLMQIILTFVSGLFGALLVTLVLIVYPGNQIMTVADARPVTRTFLGGFIALCVYIVLLGGSAVLGSAASQSGAGDNYMAFAGIGILAGMFSDRVAGWLSKRADEFFKQ
jgi:hypothetical protein